MNILHVCGSFNTGGVTTFVRSLLKLNSDSEFPHDLFILFESEKVKINNINVYFIEKGTSIVKRFNLIRAILKKYDVIMLHKAHPKIVLPLLLYKKKIFLFQHGMTVSNGILLKRIVKKIWYSLIPILLNAKVIYSSEFAIRKNRENGIIISEKKNIIIPFGIEMRRNTKMNVRNNNTIEIGTAGSLAKIKRFDLLLESLKNYKGKIKLNLKIAGTGPQEEYLKKIVPKKNPLISIEFLGNVENMENFYDSLDLFVFPSHNESFGLVVLESLFRGIPVAVFSDLGGALSLVKDNYNGFILSEGINSLEKLWHRLNSDSLVLRKMKKNIIGINFDEYRIEKTFDKLNELAKSK